MRNKAALLALCTCAGSAAAQLSDPMAPPGAIPAGNANFGTSGAVAELQAILSGPGRRLAIINGNLVQIGERIPGDGVLLSVGSDSALVQSGDKHIVLRLHAKLQQKDAKP